MYNVLFGRNPMAPVLLRMLDLTSEMTGRFRDAWVEEDGEHIVVYTRNGGGNRDCWELDGCKNETDAEGRTVTVHDPACMTTINGKLQKHPLYVSDKDDDFDCTYASFTFRVPEQYREEVKQLQAAQAPDTGKPLLDRTEQVMADIKSMTPEQIRKEFPQISAIVDKISEESKEGTPK